MRSLWPTCRSAITFWRAAPCKAASSCPSLLWLLDQNNGKRMQEMGGMRSWRTAKTPGLAELRKKPAEAAELKSLVPALLFLLVFASAGFSCTPQDPARLLRRTIRRPAESAASTPAPVATSFQISGIVKAGKDAAAWRNCHPRPIRSPERNLPWPPAVNGNLHVYGACRARPVTLVRAEFMSFAPQTQEIVLKPETPTGKFDAEMILASRQPDQRRLGKFGCVGDRWPRIPKLGRWTAHFPLSPVVGLAPVEMMNGGGTKWKWR